MDPTCVKDHSNPTYVSWAKMRNRCLNKNHDTYHRYGGRGITIDPAWDDFDTFVADMGERPAGKSLDRIDNNKGYSKSNCRWATQEEQCNNRNTSRLITHNGKTMSLSQWSRKTGIPKMTLFNRLGPLGWTVERALAA